MWIVKKAFSTLFLAIIFVGAMFVSVDIHTENVPNTSWYVMSIDSLTIVSAQAATAAGTWSTNTNYDKVNESIDGVANWINAGLWVLTMLVSPFIIFASWLLSPDWITGEVFGLREPMYRLWITVSNIIYFIYAVLLIFIALATIFNSEKYKYSQMLPRLFLGIVLVPFTWFFVQFVLSVATVATSAVLEIPRDTIAKLEANKAPGESFWTRPSIPRVITADTVFDSFTAMQQKCQNGNQGNGQTNKNCIAPKDLTEGVSGIYGPMLIYAYGIFKVQDIKTVNTSGLDTAKNVLNLTTDLMIGAVMFIVFAVITIALVAVLFMRAVYMWLYAMLSPLFTFKIVFKDWKGDGSDLFEIPQFIGLAFVPAIVGLVLSFGLIVVSTVSTGMYAGNNGTGETCDLFSETWCRTMTIMGNPNNEMRIRIVDKEQSTAAMSANGAVSGDASKGTRELTKTVNTLTTVTIGKDTDNQIMLQYWGSLEKWTNISAFENNSSGGIIGIFGSLLIQFIAIIFVWVAFKSVGNMSKIASKVVKPVAELTEKASASVGKSISLPLVGSVGGAMAAKTYMEQRVSNKNIDYHNQFANSPLGKMFNVPEQSKPSNQNIQATIHGHTYKIDYNSNTVTADQVGKTSIEKIAQHSTTGVELTNNIQAFIRNIMDKAVDNAGKFDPKILKAMLTADGLASSWIGQKLISQATSMNAKLSDHDVSAILNSFGIEKQTTITEAKQKISNALRGAATHTQSANF